MLPSEKRQLAIKLPRGQNHWLLVTILPDFEAHCQNLHRNLFSYFQSLFSTTAFGLGAKYFAFYEIEGVGVQWNNLQASPVEADDFNLLMVFLMMIFDALLYGLLTWYIENVHPGKWMNVSFISVLNS